MRKTWGRIPQLESLETMALLSGVAAAAHHHVAAEVAPPGGLPMIPVGSTALEISGTAQGGYVRFQRNPDTGSTYRFFASGQLTPLGSTIETGTIKAPGFIRGELATGTVHILAAKGTVTLQLTQEPTTTSTAASPIVYHFNYGITKATGAYKGDQGAGTVDVTLTPKTTSTSPAGTSFGTISLVYAVPTTPIS